MKTKRAAETRRVQADRMKRLLAQQEERRILNIATDAADNAKRMEEAELRGFYKGRNQALTIVLDERKNWSKDLVKDVLAGVSEAICYMEKEA